MRKARVCILMSCFCFLGSLIVPFNYAAAQVRTEPVPWQEFKNTYGDNWQVKWNEKTGTPHRVFGNKKPVSQKGNSLKRSGRADLLSENEFENIARVFIDQNNGLFKISNKDLELLRSKKHGSVFYVTFKQLFKNIPVYNSRVDFQFDNEGSLILFGADIYPDINIAVLQQISAEDAVTIVKDDVKFNQLKDDIVKPELFIYPEDTKEGFKYSLVWRLVADIKKPRGKWIYFVDAANGKIKMKYNDIKNYITGKVTGYILPFQIIDVPQEVSFPYESVYIYSNGNPDKDGVSDKDGNYTVPAYPGSYSLVSRMEGRYLKVTNANWSDAYYSVAVNDGDSLNIIWDTGVTSGRYDEMNVYYHSMRMHDYIKSIDPLYTYMDYSVPASVGEDMANAFWDGDGLAFGFGDDMHYKNFALFADIIYHEYSHGVNGKLYIHESGKSLDYIDGTESGAMEEGFADYWACSMTGNPLFGDGILFTREDMDYLRTIDNDRVYPDDLVDEVHEDGLIISGAMWKTRKELGREKADKLFHFARYALPTTFEDFFFQVLRNDDDNDDLSDGTPDALTLYSAFGSHGISGLQIRSISVDDRDEGNDNGKMNPGEKLKLIVTLENNMFENAEDVQAVLSTKDTYTKILSAQAGFGSISEGGEKSGSFTILLNNSAPIDILVSFSLKVSNKKGYIYDLPFSVNVSGSVEKKWRIEKITSVSDMPDYASNRALNRDMDGNLHLVFGDRSLSYAFYNGDKWAMSVVDNTSSDPYNYSLAMADNVPHMVYNYSDNDSCYLKYAKLSNGQWETKIINSTDSSQYSYPALAFDTGNTPQISYADNNYISYSYQSSDVWVTETVDTVYVGSNNSIGVGKNNLIQVAYYDYSSKALMYTKKIGTTWESQYLDNTLDAGKYVSLVMGPNGNPQLCYYDNTKGNLKYMHWNGYSEIVDMDGDVGLYPSMAIDSNNLPHIVYYDRANGALKYAFNNGKFWEVTKIDDSDDAGYCPSLVIDGKGMLSAVYYSKSSDGNTYIKFATSSFMTSPVYLQPWNNSIIETTAVTLRWKMEGEREGDVLKYDVYLDTSGANTKIAENISDSSYEVTNLEYGKVYYWRIIYHDQNRFEFKCAIHKFKTPIIGDIDKNGMVDGDDLVSFSGSFGSTSGFDTYNSTSDIDCNGRVDGSDLMFLGMNFGKNY